MEQETGRFVFILKNFSVLITSRMSSLISFFFPQKPFQAAVLGQIVLTDYNNRTYRVDDVNFELSPGSSFERKNNESITYVEYYQKQYGIRIRDVSVQA